MFDDVDFPDLPWPYAAKAIVQHNIVDGDLLITLTFRFHMDTEKIPLDSVWTVLVNGIDTNVDSSLWLDEWTIELTLLGISAGPADLSVAYGGPDPLLTTAWDKQWEPWGALQSTGPTGTPYGTFKGNEINWTQVAAQFTWYTISDSDISADEQFLCEFQNNQEIKVLRAGTYKMNYYISVECSIANKHVVSAIEINGTEQLLGLTHFEFGRANEESTWSAPGIFTLAINDLVSISILTDDPGSPTLTVNHIGLTINRINP